VTIVSEQTGFFITFAFLRDCELSDFDVAISVASTVEPVLVGIERCLLRDSALGIASGSPTLFGESLQVGDTAIVDCGTGIRSFGAYSPFRSTRVRRSRIQNCASDAVRAEEGARVLLADCLLHGSATGVSLGAPSPSLAGLQLDVQRSTITANGVGIWQDAPPAGSESVGLSNAIVYGNAAADVSTASSVVATHSDTAPLLPGEGNLSVDPAFVDPLAGNFHLSSSSPLIDAGDPEAQYGALDADATGPGTVPPNALGFTDLDGDPRILDGDLDSNARLDMGYDEHNVVHIEIDAQTVVGGTLSFSATAEPLWIVCLWFSTKSNEYGLGALGSVLIGPAVSTYLGAAPAPWNAVLAVPQNLSLAGMTIYSQVLGVSPTGLPASLSNRGATRIQ
jgi:hypothetical protein